MSWPGTSWGRLLKSLQARECRCLYKVACRFVRMRTKPASNDRRLIWSPPLFNCWTSAKMAREKVVRLPISIPLKTNCRKEKAAMNNEQKEQVQFGIDYATKQIQAIE